MKDTTIAGLARAAGVGVETIRFYQRRGLMPTPARAGGNDLSGGIRRYGEAEASRLRFIRQAQAAGFSLDQIRELLELDASHDHGRARALAESQLAVLDQKIAALQAARSSLQRLAKACNDAKGPCPILGAFG